jgi:hypothetical protein
MNTATDAVDHHVSNFALDRLASGTLDAGARATTEAHLAACPSCRQRQQHLADDRARFSADADFLARLAPPADVADVADNVVAFPLRRRLLQAVVPVLAAAATVTIMLRPAAVDETTTKGGAIHEAFVQGATGTRSVVDGARVQAGDVVQFTRTATTAGYVGLFSIDGRGTFSRFVPADGPTLVALQAGTRVALPQSVQLDGTPGAERFVIVDCDRAIAVDVAANAARTGASPDGCVVVQHRLEKP